MLGYALVSYQKLVNKPQTRSDEQVLDIIYDEKFYDKKLLFFRFFIAAIYFLFFNYFYQQWYRPLDILSEEPFPLFLHLILSKRGFTPQKMCVY